VPFDIPGISPVALTTVAQSDHIAGPSSASDVEIVSLEKLKPFPKAAARKTVGRRQQRTRILTDTPVREELRLKKKNIISKPTKVVGQVRKQKKGLQKPEKVLKEKNKQKTCRKKLYSMLSRTMLSQAVIAKNKLIPLFHS